MPLTGEWVQAPTGNSADGLVATPDGRALTRCRQTALSAGQLYNVSLKTGYVTTIALTGAEEVVNGDGLGFRMGHTLYVVQNRMNLVSVWDLDAKAATATPRTTITDPRFDVPANAARYGNHRCLVDARFTSPQTPEATFDAVAVSI
ncbi:hypothetical protein [Streptomyces sp. NPDC058632]|uniref:hypothetical protein n=1 Tax=Streptomyces sp. NPDC058632 TaxID=3346567 RepID=UPI00366778B9